MSIRKRGGVYWVRVQVAGQRIERSAGIGATKEQAKELEAKIRADVHAGRVGRQPDRRISEAILEWLDGECKTLKSARAFESHARALLPFIAGKRLQDAPAVAEDIKRGMSRDGLRPATINRRLAILRRVLNIAYKQWGWLDHPVGDRITLLPEHNERHLYLTPDEVDALAAACQSPVGADAIRLAAYTGLRLSELVRLAPANYRDGCLVLDAQTKSGRPRIIPVPAEAVPIIARLPFNRCKRSLERHFELARAAIGRPELHFHDLRHSYASWLVQAGAPLTAVRDLLGHSNLGVTSRYAHLASEHLVEAVDKMAQRVKSGTGRKRQANESTG